MNEGSKKGEKKQMTEFEKTSDIEKLLSVWNIPDDKKDEVKEILKKIIKKYRQGNNEGADVNLGAVLKMLNCENLDEAVQINLKELLWNIVQKESAYSKADFDFNFGQGFNNPLKESISTGSDISGPDSNRFTSINKRFKDKDGIYRSRPELKPQDDEEDEIADKLKKLKKLFQGRNAKEITIDDIRKILTSESQEQQFSALQYLKEAQTAIDNTNDCGANEQQVMDYYFSESSPISSTFSHSAWSGFKYIRVNKTGLVVHSNTFLCEPGTILTSKKQSELEGMGTKIYFSESLNEGFNQFDSILDDISYDELRTTVFSNIENPDIKAVVKQFEELLKMKIKDAQYELRKAAPQIVKEIENEYN
jgi:hypothetical protein